MFLYIGLRYGLPAALLKHWKPRQAGADSVPDQIWGAFKIANIGKRSNSFSFAFSSLRTFADTHKQPEEVVIGVQTCRLD